MAPDGNTKTGRRDSTVQVNTDINMSNDANELDPWTAWAYKPHTISLLLLGACLLM